MATADTSIQLGPRTDLVPGYRLVQIVGRGGMGEVHQAVQLSLGRTVALKLLNPDLAKDEQFVARFEKEAAALAALRHPNIVSIVDRGRNDETYFLVMEFVDGPSLRERMRDPDFDGMSALRVFAQMARAIEYAHGRGIIHRDLKPENILFDEQAGGIPKVSDFGLAGFEDGAGGAARNLTQTNMAMGTAAYMAPEQRVDARTAGPRADIYALGVMLYELVVGEVPLGTFDAPSQRKPELDRRLDAIVDRCLKPAPDDRYPSVTALLEDLEPLVPTTALPSQSKETPVQRVARQAKAVALKVYRGVGVGLVVASAVVIGAAFVRAKNDSRRVPSAVELMTDFGAKFPLTTSGRLDKPTRTLTLGKGPDTIGVMALGRKPALSDGELHYPPPDDDPTGRAVVDAQLQADGLVFSSRVDTQAVAPSMLEPLWAVVRGPRPDARSALMLLGEHGRYVALVISGTGGEPVVEWALGPDRRGMMRAPLPTQARDQVLQLRIDPASGDLAAIVGADRDARVLGDPLQLGPAWKNLFGEMPRAAVGCLAGACAFRALRVEGLALPPPPPPPPPAAVEEEKPAKPVAAAVRPGRPSKKPPAKRR